MREETIRMSNPESRKPRANIGGADSAQEMLLKMAEGNPGGLNVCMQIMQKGNPLVLLDLDDMNIRGSQLWVAFKDFAKHDIDVLIKASFDRSQALVDAVNAEIRNTGGHRAVVTGASFKRPPMEKL